LGLRFERDAAKCELNVRERGLDFADAVSTFEDAARKIWKDDRRDYGERRYSMLAKNAGRIFSVTFTMRNGVVRIISFRKANQREVVRYEQS
jgi:uncharacterized protein